MHLQEAAILAIVCAAFHTALPDVFNTFQLPSPEVSFKNLLAIKLGVHAFHSGAKIRFDPSWPIAFHGAWQPMNSWLGSLLISHEIGFLTSKLITRLPNNSAAAVPQMGSQMDMGLSSWGNICRVAAPALLLNGELA